MPPRVTTFGLKVNQSKIGLQWLYYQDKQLGGNRIKHRRNGGEQVLQIKGGRVTVDGYDPLNPHSNTKMVVEVVGKSTFLLHVSRQPWHV